MLTERAEAAKDRGAAARYLTEARAAARKSLEVWDERRAKGPLSVDASENVKRLVDLLAKPESAVTPPGRSRK